MIAAVALLASAIGLPGGWSPREVRVAQGATTLIASAPEAGLIAIAGPVPGRIRVLFARNGAMVLLREISVPGTGQVRPMRPPTPCRPVRDASKRKPSSPGIPTMEPGNGPCGAATLRDERRGDS
jgi:hypothetical protein